MKIKDLIAELKKLPQNADIAIDTSLYKTREPELPYLDGYNTDPRKLIYARFGFFGEIKKGKIKSVKCNFKENKITIIAFFENIGEVIFRKDFGNPYFDKGDIYIELLRDYEGENP